MQKGRSFFVTEFGIKYLRRGDAHPTRIGIVVPKKITKTIVKRNRIKRQIRHVFVELLDGLHPGYDITLVARAPIMELAFGNMKGKIAWALEKARCLSALHPSP